jgi:hypothetical protein
MTSHEKLAMEISGHDYVTYRLGGKRCHHKTTFVCMECGASKSYFTNLMGYRGNPMCDGITQKLSVPARRREAQ